LDGAFGRASVLLRFGFAGLIAMVCFNLILPISFIFNFYSSLAVHKSQLTPSEINIDSIAAEQKDIREGLCQIL
jgi:hypothetical protein